MKPMGMVYRVTDNGCHEVTSHIPDHKGYIRITVGGRPIRAHRYIYEKTHGPIPDGMCVCHHCDNRACINPDHLFLGTYADNAHDMIAKGRNSIGMKHGSAKLTDDDIMAIRSATGLMRHMAKKYGVSRQEISYIRAGKMWKHIGDPVKRTLVERVVEPGGKT